MPTTDEPAPEPPTWQALHEFDRVVDQSAIDQVEKAGGSFLSNAKQVELTIFELKKAHGAKKMFD